MTWITGAAAVTLKALRPIQQGDRVRVKLRSGVGYVGGNDELYCGGHVCRVNEVHAWTGGCSHIGPYCVFRVRGEGRTSGLWVWDEDIIAVEVKGATCATPPG